MKALILARHAHAESNAGAIVNATPPGGGLSDAGREEARTLGVLVSSDRIDIGFSSRLLRTQQTLELALADRRRSAGRRAAARRDRLRLLRGRLSGCVPEMGLAARAGCTLPRRRREQNGRCAPPRRRPCQRSSLDRRRRCSSSATRCRSGTCSTPRTACFPPRGSSRCHTPHRSGSVGPASFAPPRRFGAGRWSHGSPIPRLVDDARRLRADGYPGMTMRRLAIPLRGSRCCARTRSVGLRRLADCHPGAREPDPGREHERGDRHGEVRNDVRDEPSRRRSIPVVQCGGRIRHSGEALADRRSTSPHSPS